MPQAFSLGWSYTIPRCKVAATMTNSVSAQDVPRPHRPRGVRTIGKVGRGLPSTRCGESPSPEFIQGIREFNRGEFFEAHETLELIWMEETDPLRYLYQGILQIGVGFYHLSRGNYKGAIALWERGLRLLEPFRNGCLGVDVIQLMEETSICQDTVKALGPGRLYEFELTLIPKVYDMNGNPI